MDWLSGSTTISGGRRVPTASVCEADAPVTAAAKERQGIRTGWSCGDCQSPPNSPEMLRPIAKTEPSAVWNNEWNFPAAAWTTLLAMSAGVLREAVSPRPSWPSSLSPMPQSVPSRLTKREWPCPVATPATFWAMTTSFLRS